MISLLNPAFDFLRKYKPCEQHTEELVMKKIRGRISQDELITVFEKGVTGDYGKFIVADPQTLLGWVDKYTAQKNNLKNYREAGLIDPKVEDSDPAYPMYDDPWRKEANKCYSAFLNEISEINFHPYVYDRLMLDGKIELNSYLKVFSDTGDEEADTIRAKQKILKGFFKYCKDKSWTVIYFINEPISKSQVS